MAPLGGATQRRSYEAMRVSILEFLETDVFNVSVDNSVSFLDPLVESWISTSRPSAWNRFESGLVPGLREEI